MSSRPHTSVPGMDATTAEQVTAVLEERLVTLLDLGLTLEHIHWNVVGPDFLSVHEMLDDQVAPVRAMADDLAERIRTLGGTPIGTPRAIVDRRRWDDYGVGRASVFIHLEALDGVYDGVIADHRKAIEATAERSRSGSTSTRSVSTTTSSPRSVPRPRARVVSDPTRDDRRAASASPRR